MNADADGLPTSLVVSGFIIIGFMLALASCAFSLPLLRKLQVRQRTYEDAPESHQVKTGTLTMGGLCFVIALLPLLFLHNSSMPYVFALVAGCAFIGFVDDILAIRLARNRGLRARTKFLFTALMAVMFLRAIDGGNVSYPRDAIPIVGGK